MIKNRKKYSQSHSIKHALIAISLLLSVTFSNFGIYNLIKSDKSELQITLIEKSDLEGEQEEKESKYESDFEKFFLHLNMVALSHSFSKDYFELPTLKSQSPSLDTVKPPPKFTC